jgi:putative ABC transport system permease protein
MAFKVRNGIKVVQGRSFTPGLYEVIVGKKMAERVTGLDIGSTISVQKKDWKVVGLFDAGGSSFESEIWGDYNAMAPAIGRTGGCESLTVRLQDPKTLSAFDKDVRANPRVQLQIDSEPKYYENLAGGTAQALLGLAAFVSIVMSIGAVFGAMNTMYAIVSQRTREIGTLRALGFSRFSILFSFVFESVLLAALGGVLGCLLAFLTVNGLTTATGQTNSFSELVFAFQITPPVVAIGLGFAVLMGFVGGLLPALRASRMPITTALREA